jgi:hypothetical protein
LRRLPVQPWVPAGFLVGGVFLLASQVYYHYFVLVVPFAALLGAPLLVRVRIPRMLGAPLILVVVAAWAAVIDLGGQSPVFVTSAHLSDLAPTVQILDRTTHPTQPILVDRYEYAYLAHRPALAHYFWNVGVLVDARWLERRLHGSGAVVLSYGASSGYPAGFVQYLNRHYPSVPTPVTRIWLLNSK